MSNDANQFLLGAGGASAKFDQLGDSITGTILSTEIQQQRDLLTGAPMVWDNGDPRQQLVVRLQTDQRDPDNRDDDGVRAVYVKGSKKTGTKSMHDAVASAVRAAGGKGLEEGGTLTVRWVGNEPASVPGLSPRKLWEATYSGPDHAAVSGSFLGTTSASSDAPAFAQQATTYGPGSPTNDIMTPEQRAAFLAWQQSQHKS